MIGIIQEQKSALNLRREISMDQRNKHGASGAAAQDALAEIQSQLEAVKMEAISAQKLVDHLEHLPSIPEPPLQYELDHAARAVSAMEPPGKGM